MRRPASRSSTSAAPRSAKRGVPRSSVKSTRGANRAAGKTKAAKVPTRHPHPRMQSRRQILGRHYRFDRAVRKALGMGRKQTLQSSWVQDILDGFGDTSLRADDPYVAAALTAAAEARGPILQCGANALTFLIALITQQRSDYLWTLEHNSSTAHSFRSLLKRYDIRAGQIIEAPAEAFGDHIWYVMDVRQLPGEIALVLCYGSNVLPTGLRGVVRRLRDNLSQRCVLLVRQTKRPKDLDFASKWAKSCQAPFILNDRGEPFVKIALRDQAREAERSDDRALTIFDGVTEPEPLFAGRKVQSQL